jgi:hypothetical protein
MPNSAQKVRPNNRKVTILEIILRDFWCDILRNRPGNIPKESRRFTSTENSRIPPRAFAGCK